MKRSEKVFTASGVDSRLSPDRAVHLRHDGGWNLHEWNAPIVNGGNEAGQISDHTAAQCHKQSGSVQTRLNHRIANEGDLGERLGRFS